MRPAPAAEKKALDALRKLREAEVEAAQALLGETDFGALTVDTLMRETGMTRSSFYHYFSGLDDLAAIVDQATGNRAEVLLVGDHHQLPEVAAGGAFRAALDVLGDRVVELTTNRRQRHAWERAALDQLRCGDVRAAFDAYRDHGRIVIADRPDDLHALVLGDWLDAAGAERFADETIRESRIAGTQMFAQVAILATGAIKKRPMVIEDPVHGEDQSDGARW